MTSHILLGTCLQLIGANLAIDTYGGLPMYSNGVDCSMGCTTSEMGGPVEYATGQCYLPLSLDDPYYSEYLDIWCHDVTVTNLNGPVSMRTPCEGDPGVVDITDTMNIPYGIRAYWAVQACPEYIHAMGWCEYENACTAADKLNGDCSCTATEQANNECTP